MSIVACSSDDSASAKESIKDDPGKDSTSSQGLMEYLLSLENPSLNEYEFISNYMLLKMYYRNAEKELKTPEEYFFLESILETDFANTYEMYESLSDEYTFYYPPEYASLYYSYFDDGPSEVGMGIGVDESLVVKYVYEGGPAEKAGVMRGDSIKSVDGIPVDLMDTFRRLVTGKAGDKIILGVSRGGVAVSVTVVLGPFVVPTVFIDSIKNVPLIRITEFKTDSLNGGSITEFKKALEKTASAKATIIDLRNNPGGAIEACVSMAEMLLLKGDTIIVMENAMPDNSLDSQILVRQTLTAEKDGIGSDRYYVFLADSNSASCSELFLSAVTTNKKSPIVGSTTYGKGIAQMVFDGDIIFGVSVISSYMFYDKNGVSYHNRGLVPDFKTNDEEEAYAKALEFIEVEQYREAGYGPLVGSIALAKSHGTKQLAKPGAYRILKLDSLPNLKKRK